MKKKYNITIVEREVNWIRTKRNFVADLLLIQTSIIIGLVIGGKFLFVSLGSMIGYIFLLITDVKKEVIWKEVHRK